VEHLQHFGLTRDPFANDSQVDLFFASDVHSNCERRLRRGVTQGKGLCVLSGPPGTGKTMTLRHLFESLDEDTTEACLLVPVPGISDGDWVLRRFAAQLGVQPIPTDRGDVLARVYEKLAEVREEGRQAVLMIDEAQVLADGGALGELRGLLNLEYEDRRLLTVILAGLAELETGLAAEPGLMERVEISVRLTEMDANTSGFYLTHRMRASGGNPAILESGAQKRLIEHGRGNPRRLNILADNALFEAYLEGRLAATEADIEKASAELELAYAPTTSQPDLFSPGGVSTLDLTTLPDDDVDEDEVPTGEFSAEDLVPKE
jgi:type II secretory pathway predicted ATPase ExeA